MKRRILMLLAMACISLGALVLGTYFATQIPASFAFDDAWEEAAPDGDLDDISTGDDQMRQDKRAIRERMDVDHDWRSNETGITSIGYHKALHLIDQVNNTSDNQTLYNKGGDIYYHDQTGNQVRITQGGALYNTVNKTGDQTIAGTKTFSAFPVTPSSAPTTDYQAANKKYVDDTVGSIAFGDWVNVTAACSNVVAPADGFVSALGSGTNFDLIGLTDTNNPPTTERAHIQWDGVGNETMSIMMPVKSGNRWTVSGAHTVYWINATGY